MSLEGRVVLGSFRKVTEGTEPIAFQALTSAGVRCPMSGQGKGLSWCPLPTVGLGVLPVQK